MRIGYMQFRPRFGQVRKNLGIVLKALETVSADLIVLPELAFTGYYFRDRQELLSLGEDPADSPTIEALTALCRSRKMHIVTGFAERRQDKVFNSALLIGPEGLRHVYRKLHLFNEEKRCFDPGDTPLSVQQVMDARIGMMVCFDWAFPEVSRVLAMQGADIICHPSNLVLGFCQEAMLTRCLENRVFAITTNRFGADKRPQGELRFTGRSQIVAPGGQLVQRAHAQRQAVFVTRIDPHEARDKAITPLNDLLADRRPEYYRLLTDAD